MLSWLGIALILLMGLIYTKGRSWCKVKSASPLDLNRIPVNFEHLKETAGVKRRIRVMTGPWITVPVVWGIIHPILLVPKNLSSKFTKTQIRWNLLHELAHIHPLGHAGDAAPKNSAKSILLPPRGLAGERDHGPSA